MGRTTTFRAFLVPLSLVLLIACDPASPEPTAPTDGGPAPSLDGEIPPGSYVYEALGVEAVLTMDEGGGTLEVANDTGGELGVPAPYVLAADDGRRITLEISDGASIPDGAVGEFSVAWPSDTRTHIGVLVLVFGDDEFGSFLREDAE
jgi:hypothetical protein